MTLTITYSCHKCGVKDRAVNVRARRSIEEELTPWYLKVVATALQQDHHRVSRRCRVRIYDDVRIPLTDDADFIGQAPKQTGGPHEQT